MSNEEKNNLSIPSGEGSASKIEKIGSSQSFCSRSSTSSINLCVDLLSKEENNRMKQSNKIYSEENSPFRHKNDMKLIFPSKIKQSPLVTRTIKEKLSDLFSETHTITNTRSTNNKNSNILSKVNRMKTILQKEKSDYSFPTTPNINNDNLLQKKARKMLIGLKSKKLEVEADIEEFKNQLDNNSVHKKNPFGLKDFELNFKKLMKKNNFEFHNNTYNPSLRRNNTYFPQKFMKV